MAAQIQRSFSGGEITPELYGRADQAKYTTGLRTLRNMLIQRFGSVTNRSGTVYSATTKDSTKVSRLIPFRFNASQTYALEFGENYIRPYQVGVPTRLLVENTDSPEWFTLTVYAAGAVTRVIRIYSGRKS